MKKETISKRVDNAIRRYIPNENDKVKAYITDLILLTYKNLRLDLQVDDNGKPYSESRDLAFAISITLDDIDTPMILDEARKETAK